MAKAKGEGWDRVFVLGLNSLWSCMQENYPAGTEMRRVWEAVHAISLGHSSKEYGWAGRDALTCVYPAWLMRPELRKSLRYPKYAQRALPICFMFVVAHFDSWFKWSHSGTLSWCVRLPGQSFMTLITCNFYVVSAPTTLSAGDVHDMCLQIMTPLKKQVHSS